MYFLCNCPLLSFVLLTSYCLQMLVSVLGNNTPGSYGNILGRVPVLPAVNNSDLLFFLYSTESKAGSEDLKQGMESYHHQSYCTSAVCTIWHDSSVILFLTFLYFQYLLSVDFGAVVCCDLVQSGWWIIILFKSRMSYFSLSHCLMMMKYWH